MSNFYFKKEKSEILYECVFIFHAMKICILPANPSPKTSEAEMCKSRHSLTISHILNFENIML